MGEFILCIIYYILSIQINMSESITKSYDFNSTDWATHSTRERNISTDFSYRAEHALRNFCSLYSRRKSKIMNYRSVTVGWYQTIRILLLNKQWINWTWSAITSSLVPTDCVHSPWAPNCSPYHSSQPFKCTTALVWIRMGIPNNRSYLVYSSKSSQWTITLDVAQYSWYKLRCRKVW